MTSFLSSSVRKPTYNEHGHREKTTTKRFAPSGAGMLKFPILSMDRLNREISELDHTIAANKALSDSLGEKRAQLMESKGEKFFASLHADRESYSIEDMLNTEAELEEANGLLAYRKSLRERLRTRVQTMEHAASATWRAYKGRGHSRDLALALAKVAALEREIDDLHDVELSTMQREQARVKRDAKIKATTTIQNNELKAQVNTITKQLEVEREKTAALEQQVKDQDTKMMNNAHVAETNLGKRDEWLTTVSSSRNVFIFTQVTANKLL